MERRTGIVVLGTMAVVSIASVFYHSPLEEAANALATPNPAKAPWYFLWLQEIVTDTTIKLGPITINGALIGGVIVPGLLVVALAAWPWLDKSPASATGVWFHRSRRLQNLVFLFIVFVILALTFIGTFCRGPYWQLYWPWQSWTEMPGRI